jgi:23S rRNA pseudouridine2605 synthase
MAAPVRLQRYLAAAGVAARRKAEDLIVAGRVTVNGAVVTQLGSKVDPDRDQVTVDGEAVVPLDYFYVLFNKPKGCITAVSDDRGRMTVMDYLPNVPVPVKPVGRLDFYTEGVLLLTNDGELAAKLLAPASHVPKTYHVKVHGQMPAEHIKQLRNGVTLDDGTVTLPAEIETLPSESKHTWLGITIHEGKHRQIHRMVEALGYYVDKLQRVAFANLTFHHLRVGDARELTQQELNELRDLVGLDHSAVARGRWQAKREQTDIPRRARAKAMAEAEEAAAARAGAPVGADGGAGADEEMPRGAGEDDREEWGWGGGANRAPGGDRQGSADRDARRGDAGRGDDRRGPPGRDAGRGDRRGPPGRDTGRGDRRGPPGRDAGRGDRRGPPGRDAGRGDAGRGDRRGPPGRDTGRMPGRDTGRMPGSDGGRDGSNRDRRGPSGRDAGRDGSDRDRRGPPGRDAGRGASDRGASARDRRGPPGADTGRPRSFGTQKPQRQGRDRSSATRGDGPKRRGQGRSFGKRAGAPPVGKRGAPGGRRGKRR